MSNSNLEPASASPPSTAESENARLMGAIQQRITEIVTVSNGRYEQSINSIIRGDNMPVTQTVRAIDSKNGHCYDENLIICTAPKKPDGMFGDMFLVNIDGSRFPYIVSPPGQVSEKIGLVSLPDKDDQRSVIGIRDYHDIDPKKIANFIRKNPSLCVDFHIGPDSGWRDIHLDGELSSHTLKFFVPNPLSPDHNLPYILDHLSRKTTFDIGS